MPLHLLGKKSWNPYSAANIERVRRDEAEAKAKEEAEEQSMREDEAKRRLAILRGETPPAIDATIDDVYRERRQLAPQNIRKRKRAGENDTDLEVRLARERMSRDDTGSARLKSSSAPLVNLDGHIDLFVDERSRAHTRKEDVVEQEAAKKKREAEDPFTMRFSNAAGKGGLESPWYAADKGKALDVFDAPSKDVWGNEDPRRKQRDNNRLLANDPLAIMKKGASKMRDLKRTRESLQASRDRELKELKKEESRKERHERRAKKTWRRAEDAHRSRDRDRADMSGERGHHRRREIETERRDSAAHRQRP